MRSIFHLVVVAVWASAVTLVLNDYESDSGIGYLHLGLLMACGAMIAGQALVIFREIKDGM